MRMPAMYTDRSSQLFDPRRDGRHAPPKLIDLDYSGREPRFTDNQQIDHNLRVMYRQVGPRWFDTDKKWMASPASRQS
jgi:polyphenol oxidase